MLDAANVYFTWPDRALTYRCAGCGACCKGLGIGLDLASGQLTALTARRPELLVFLRRRGDAVTAFNPRDRCWFLADDGLCRVEAEDGRAAKPASCRLFPFNRVFTLGELTVVDYNSVICPLRVAAESESEHAVRHADILAEIATIQDPAIVGTRLPAEPGGGALLRAERELAASVFTVAAAPAPSANWQARLVAAGVLDGAAASDELMALLDVAPTALDPDSWRAALTVLPSLRFNELWGPRQYAPRAAMRECLPAMTRAWLALAALGAKLAGRPMGMQELTTIWSEQAPLLYVAARWTAIPHLKPGPLELPGQDPGGLVRAIGQACVDNRKAKRPFGAIVAPLLRAAAPVDRVMALKLAEPVLRAAFARSAS